MLDIGAGDGLLAKQVLSGRPDLQWTAVDTLARPNSNISVQFFDGASSLGTATLSGGTASLSTAALSVGTHSITAAYGGNSSYAASTSSALVCAGTTVMRQPRSASMRRMLRFTP